MRRSRRNHPRMIRWEGVPAGLASPQPSPSPWVPLHHRHPPASRSRHPSRQEAASGSVTSLRRLYRCRSAWELARATDININKACCWGPPVRGCQRRAQRRDASALTSRLISLSVRPTKKKREREKKEKSGGLVLSQELLLGPCHSCTITELFYT